MVIGGMMAAREAEFNLRGRRVGITATNAVIPDGKADPGSCDENGVVSSLPLAGRE
jgi:hypothetical protein